jgi:hypothetical protein
MRMTAKTPPMRETRNRVVQVGRFGAPDGLEVVDAPLPMPGRDEVRVRALASGLEYTDVLIPRHLYPQTMLRRSRHVTIEREPPISCAPFYRIRTARCRICR